MAKFPLRALGLLLLTVTIFGASCQALVANLNLTAVVSHERSLADRDRG